MESQFSELAPYIALASFAIAVLALVFAIRGDRRKTGVDIRSSFSVASSISSKEKWVDEVRLENVKDRSVTIYRIYLEIGHGIYVEVQDLTSNPFTLGPYSVYQKKYDPIEFYSHGLTRLTGVIGNEKIRRRIVLSTSQGRHLAKAGVRTDDPILDTLLKNYWTGVVRPERLLYEDRCYGSEAKYIVTLYYNSGKEEIVPIYSNDHQIRKFHDFRLTQESLESKTSLECLLQAQVSAGAITCSSFEVVDLVPLRQGVFKDYTDSMVVEHNGWFFHNVIARCLTVWEKRKMDRMNRRRQTDS